MMNNSYRETLVCLVNLILIVLAAFIVKDDISVNKNKHLAQYNVQNQKYYYQASDNIDNSEHLCSCCNK